jgi:hypothetical protein
MDNQDDKARKGIGLPEAAGSVAAGAATGFAALITAYKAFQQPAIQKAGDALKEAERKARELYTEASGSLNSVTPGQRQVWIDQQVHAAPEVTRLRQASNSIPRPTTSREVFANMSTKGKITLGVAVVATGLATGYLINKWRNRDANKEDRTTPSAEQLKNYYELKDVMGAMQTNERGR